MKMANQIFQIFFFFKIFSFVPQARFFQGKDLFGGPKEFFWIIFFSLKNLVLPFWSPRKINQKDRPSLLFLFFYLLETQKYPEMFLMPFYAPGQALLCLDKSEKFPSIMTFTLVDKWNIAEIGRRSRLKKIWSEIKLNFTSKYFSTYLFDLLDHDLQTTSLQCRTWRRCHQKIGPTVAFDLKK